MVKLENGGIKDILPANLLTPETLSVSYAFEQAQKKMFEYVQALHLYAGIKQVPERILDLLALELGTQYYDQTLERSAKERLVTRTLVWYMHAGTPSVLNEFLGTVLEGGSIEEWYAYGGKPYYFRAYVQTGDSEIPLGYGTDVKRCIGIYKNVRSWLEYLMFVTGGEFEVPIEYGNHVTFGGRWYPLGDVPLKLDGKWKLDGGKKLSRYIEPVDHYHSRLTVGMCFLANTEYESGGTATRTGTPVPVEGRTEAVIFTGKTEPKLEYSSGLTLKSRKTVDIQTGDIRITVNNKLDSTWKLDGTRNLNGGLYLR